MDAIKSIFLRGLKLQAAALCASTAAGAVRPDFSFVYDGRRLTAADCGFAAGCGTRTFELGGGVSVTLEETAHDGRDAAEWLLWFENKGTSPSGMFGAVNDADVVFTMPATPKGNPDPAYCAYPFTGTEMRIASPNGSDWKYEEFYCDPDKPSVSGWGGHYSGLFKDGATKKYSPKGGRSSEASSPFFNINACGRGMIAAVGWSGQWKAEFVRTEGTNIAFRAGLADAEFRLLPGERFRTARILLMSYEGDMTDGQNKWRRFVKDILAPVGRAGAPAEEELPFCCNFWGGLTSRSAVERIAKVRDAGLPYKWFWMDAGWYGMSATPSADEFSGDWYESTGDWRMNPHRHPDGLRDVVRAAHEAGRKFVLWFEPERALRGVPAATEHPDWFLERGADNTLLLDLGNPDAWNYAFCTVSNYIAELRLDCYRQDFNMSPLEYWRAKDAPDRKGVTEIRHIMGLYRLWDTILATFPGILIDNCASGGRRIDIETLRRAVPLWRSDAQCPANPVPEFAQGHAITYGAWMPYSGTGAGRGLGDVYAWRSAYAPALSTNPAFAETQVFPKNPGDFDFIRRYGKEYLRLRPLLSCDLYPFTDPADWLSAWSAAQYNRPEKGDGAVLAFRRPKSPCVRAEFKLRGLDAGRVYEIEDSDTGAVTERTGRSLMKDGLAVEMDSPRSSRLVFYRAKDAADAASAALRGGTAAGRTVFAAGETMTFTVKVDRAEGPRTEGLSVRWLRRGDDGVTGDFRETPGAGGVSVFTTAMDAPGYVSVDAWLEDAAGNAVLDGRGRRVEFRGGALVDPERIAPSAEPADFDAFWARQKSELAAVPVRELSREIFPAASTDSCRVFKVKVACAGPRALTAWLSVPAKGGKYPAVVTFRGYGVHSERMPEWGHWGADGGRIPGWTCHGNEGVIHLRVNAHGCELGRDGAYYRALADELRSAGGCGYALDPEENANPETAYFRGMALRAARAVEYVKTLPEWDGRTLHVDGASQGGMEAVWVSALVPGVTKATVSIPWGCDFGGKELAGRFHGGWRPQWSPGLAYYDCVNFARRVPETLELDMPFAALGDEICPASGVALFYNALRCRKSVRWVQNMTHGYDFPETF